MAEAAAASCDSRRNLDFFFPVEHGYFAHLRQINANRIINLIVVAGVPDAVVCVKIGINRVLFKHRVTRIELVIAERVERAIVVRRDFGDIVAVRIEVVAGGRTAAVAMGGFRQD